jgi:hypothetical protein
MGYRLTGARQGRSTMAPLSGLTVVGRSRKVMRAADRAVQKAAQKLRRKGANTA